jgi:hypothetical protein
VPPDLVDAGHHRRLERRGVAGAAATMRAPVRAAASLQHQSDVRERRRSPVQHVLLPIGPEMTAFALKPLSFPTFGSRYLIRKYRTDEVRVQGCPVPNWGSRYGTDGLSTTLSRIWACILFEEKGNRGDRSASHDRS